jgi:hypothetical protein
MLSILMCPVYLPKTNCPCVATAFEDRPRVNSAPTRQPGLGPHTCTCQCHQNARLRHQGAYEGSPPAVYC